MTKGGHIVGPGATLPIVDVDPTQPLRMDVMLARPLYSQSNDDVAYVASALLPPMSEAVDLMTAAINLHQINGDSTNVQSDSLNWSIPLTRIDTNAHMRQRLESKLHVRIDHTSCHTATPTAIRPSLPLHPTIPTACISFATSFKLFNHCAVPILIRSAIPKSATSASSFKTLEPWMTEHGVDCLEWNERNGMKLSMGLPHITNEPEQPSSVDSAAYWSQPFSTHIPVKEQLASDSSMQVNHEVDILSVSPSFKPGQRGRVVLHQFVVSIKKQPLFGAQSTLDDDGTSRRADSSIINQQSHAAALASFCTIITIRPRYVLHNRTGVSLRIEHLGSISRKPALQMNGSIATADADADTDADADADATSSSRGVNILRPRAIHALDGWAISAVDERYDAKEPHSFGPAVRFSFMNQSGEEKSTGGEHTLLQEWSWSRNVRIRDEQPRSSLSVYNRLHGFERLLNSTVLKYDGVRHVMLFRDEQPPYILLNRTNRWMEYGDARLTDRMPRADERGSPLLAPGQCSEFQLREDGQKKQHRSSMADGGNTEHSAKGEATHRRASSSNWSSEERVFEPPQYPDVMALRLISTAISSRSGRSRTIVSHWSPAMRLRPGEFVTNIAWPSGNNATTVRIAIALWNGSILIVVDEADQHQTHYPWNWSQPASIIGLQVSSLTLMLHDETRSSSRSAHSTRANPTSVPNDRPHPMPSPHSFAELSKVLQHTHIRHPISNMGELLLVVSLDGLRMQTRWSSEQPLHLYQSIMDVGEKTGSSTSTRLTTLSPSILPQRCTTMRLSIQSIQIDNELECECPVVLFSFHPSGSSSTAQPEPAVDVTLVSSRFQPHALPLSAIALLHSSDFHLLSLRLSSFAVSIEDALLFRLMAISKGLMGDISATAYSARTTSFISPSRGTCAGVKASAFHPSDGHQRAPDDTFPRQNLTQSTGVSIDVADLMDRVCKPRLFVHYLHLHDMDFRVTMKAGSVAMFVGAEQMPVRLDTMSLRSVLCSPDRLVQEIAAHYLASAIIRSPMLLGSLDLLGNPTFLLHSMGRGLRDLLLMPRAALPQGPRAFVHAVGGGMLSLLRHTTEGTLTSVTGFSSSLARNMDRLGGNDRFTLQRQMSRVRRSGGGLGSGLLSGVTSLSQSVLGGAWGVVSEPISGARQGGSWGFVKGVGTGLVGAVSKPLSGVFDLVAHTSQGIAQATGVESSSHVHRARRRSERSQLNEREPPHILHRFSLAKLQLLATRMDETYVDHAVVALVPLENSSISSTATSDTSPQSVSSIPSPISIPTPSSAASFLLLLVTSDGVRLMDEEAVIAAFPWTELQLSVTRPQPHQLSSVRLLFSSDDELATAFLDDRHLIAWKRGEHGERSAALNDSDDSGSTEQLSRDTRTLSLDLLLLRSSHMSHANAYALLLPRSIKSKLMTSIHEAESISLTRQDQLRSP